MDVLLATGLKTLSILSCSYLPQLGVRFIKTHPFGEPQNPNRMTSDAMDNPIRPRVNKLFARMGP
uniref:Uncharacterized protein n=1 Tax=Fagus sylvatica TaxID=28930 RepID=A0A2N9J041_FAGSY